MKKLTLTLIVFALTISLCSAEDIGKKTKDRWEFEFSLYGWLAESTTNFAARNRTGSVEMDLDYILDNLENANYLNFNAKQGAWTFFLDRSYTSLADDDLGTRGSINDAQLKLKFLEFGAAFEVYRKQSNGKTFLVEVLLAGRDADIDISTQFTTFNLVRSKDWFELFSGLRLKYQPSRRWQIWLRNDFTVSSTSAIDNTKSFTLGAKYRANRVFSYSLAYKRYDVDFTDGEGLLRLEADIEFKGPALAITYHF